MSLQPIQSFSEATVIEVNDQINGSAAADSAIPIDELGAFDREDDGANRNGLTGDQIKYYTGSTQDQEILLSKESSFILFPRSSSGREGGLGMRFENLIPVVLTGAQSFNSGM